MKKNKSILFVVATIFLALLFYLMNYYTPLMTDDYSYSFIWGTDNKLTSFADIIPSMCAHYTILGGRIVTQTLSQVFLLAGKPAFNLINTIVFMLMCGLMSHYASIGRVKYVMVYILVYLTLFLFTPAFGQSFLWLDGSSVYEYSVFLMLLMLLPYTQRKRISPTALIILTFWQFLMGFISNDTIENVGAAIVVMMLCLTIYGRVCKSQKLPFIISGLLGSVLGCIFLIKSPGTQIRLAIAGGMNLTGILKNVVYITLNLVQHFWVILLALALAIVAIWKNSPIKKVNNKERWVFLLKEYSIEVVCTMGFLASVYAMILSPQFPDRAWTCPTVLLIIVTFRVVLRAVEVLRDKIRIELNVATAVLLMAFLCTWINAYWGLKNTYYENEYREQIIYSTIDNGEREVELVPIRGYSKYSCFGSNGDLAYNSEEWPNTAIARYYGLDKVERVEIFK